MPKTIVRCDACGELILQPYDEQRVNRCPGCGRMMSLDVVDLSDRPEVLRRLKAIQQERPVTSKDVKI
jgi:acetyl-CoA carboxylase beta subunit